MRYQHDWANNFHNSNYIKKESMYSMMVDFRKPLNNSFHEMMVSLYWTYRLVKWCIIGHDMVIVNDKVRRATRFERKFSRMGYYDNDSKSN